MDSALFIDAARALHLVGLALGLGIGMAADLSAGRLLFRPFSENELETLHRLHNMVAVGIILLWVSGLAILWDRTGFDPAQFSPKLITKLGVVFMLTANAFAIARIALPVMCHFRGYAFGDMPIVERLRLGIVAGLSASCWVSALALGVFSQMKTMPFDHLGALLGPVYIVILTGALTMAIVSPAIVFVTRRVPALAR